MKKHTIELVPLGKKLIIGEGVPLIDILHEYGIEFPCGGKGTCGRCRVKVLKGEIRTDKYHRDQLSKLKLDPSWRLACLSRCTSDLVLEVAQYEAMFKADESSFDFTPGEGLGVAFDLGTTTLVGQLLDLETGRILGVDTALNPQAKFGGDLISRIESAMGGSGEEMVGMIREKTGEMMHALCRGCGKEIRKVIMVGNTVMQHLFCDADVTPLATYPFEPPDLGKRVFSAGDLGWNVPVESVEFYPSIGSFVGSDILAGIMAAGMHTREETTVLIDIGTNGEIVIGNREGLLCASTAAGPAFEGSKISMGMLATTGAISRVTADGDHWEYQVIGNAEPRGICGSGLIDVVALLLEGGKIGGFGEILSGEGEIALAGQVRVTQRDIQEFQLAKAAIATGLEILMDRLSIGPDHIRQVYIAGGFGSYINLDNVVRTGMLRCDPERMRQLGNTALIGAKMFLFGDGSGAASILEKTTHVHLESEPRFQDLYIKHMEFTR